MPHAAFAARKPMLRDTIQATFSGAILMLDTPLGHRIPVAYGSDGSLAGQSKDLAFYLGSVTDRGVWWVSGDKLCHKWQIWFDKKANCLTLHHDSRRVWWRRDDGETGTAMLIHAGLSANAPATASTRKTQSETKTTAAVTSIDNSKPQAATRYRVTGVLADDVLNIRSQPSSEAAIVGTLSNTARGIVISEGCTSEWCRVVSGGKPGWVNRYYLTPETTSVRQSAVIR